MSFHSFDQHKFDKWTRQISSVYKHPIWNIYDADIQRIVNSFDQFNSPKGAGYVPPRWQLIKAQLWVETGAGSDYWKMLPMQIGMKGDQGVLDVLDYNHVHRVSLVTPPDIRRHLDLATIRSNPVVNIEAGLTLLHLKMAFFASCPKPVEHTHFAGHHQQKAPAHQPVHHESEAYVTAWRPFNPVTLYQQYNVGDAAYAAKLNFCMDLIGS